MANESDSPKPTAAPDARAAAPELRLLDRRAFVGFPALEVVPGLRISDFALQIPDVSFPFNVSAGATRYQRKKLHFGFLELSVDADLVTRRVAELAGRLAGLEEVRLHFRPGYLEGQGRLPAPERTPFTFKVAFDADGEKLAVYLYDVRLYGFSSTPSVQVPGLLSAAVGALALVPDVEVRGASGFSTRVLPALCQLAAVSRGYKMPSLDTARLSAAEVSSTGLRLRFAAGGLPPPSAPDEELLLTLEGARAFADAEGLVAQGRLAEARQQYLQAGDAQDAHPFAAERLLSLLVADPQAHELALDVAATLQRRRDRSPAALWGEAVVRERRGEGARAAERYLALCALARRTSEEAAAFFSAEAAARCSRDTAPQVAVKALHELLGLKPDHLPSLKALARASDQARDKAGAVRAYRRLAALARDPHEAADAHVHLARLCAQTEDDIAGARLHCEAALRLSPDQSDALLLLGELCHRGGEHLRALKALDRLREVSMARHELDRVGHADLMAGRVWEEGLKQPENALLRYREAVSLLPGEAEPLFAAARVAEGLGRLQEALAGYQQALELAGPAPRSEGVRHAAHASHHALARLYRSRLGDPARAREHLESALSLDPRDAVALEELIPYFRITGKSLELADALEKSAALQDEPAKRAASWAEAGELYRGRLQQPEKAEKLLLLALEADADHRPALESLLALAEARRDGPLLTRCLSALARLAPDVKERAQKYRRLAVAARDLAFDLDLAVHSLQEVLRAEPDDLPALGELCALQRKRADMAGLAVALEERARVAEAQGDKRLAAAALRELAGVLEARLGRVGDALVALEKAARLAPDSAVLLDLADLSLRCERPEHARRALESLLSTLPRTAAPEKLADVRARLGRACEMLGDREGAIAAYAQALPLRRLDDTLAARLESLYTEAGETQALAELWAGRAQALMGADRAEEAAPLFLQSARALLERGEKAAALLRLTAALEASPQGPLAAEVLESLAELELERGEKLEAARLYARRAALVPEDRSGAKLLYRASLLAAGTSREEAFLAEALERDASFAPARQRRGELKLPTDARSALEDFEAVLALPPVDADAPREAERVALTRKAASAAVRAGRTDSARRLLSEYCIRAPEDLDARVELVNLHRKAGAREALADLLVELWPRLSGEPRRAARRELAELSLVLGRAGAAVDSLRSLRLEEPQDTWAAQALLDLLPPPGTGSSDEEAERLELLGALVASATGEDRSELLARRAVLHRATGRISAAREDFSEAATLARRPAALLLALAELARESGDEAGELEVWRRAVVADAQLGTRARERLLALATVLAEKDERGLAREALVSAVALSPSDAERCDAFFTLADLAHRDERPDEEAAALAEAARQGPTPRRVEALLARATLLETRGELAEARGSLQAALALAPRHARATVSLQRALRALEDWAALAELLAAEAPHAPPSESAAMYAELASLYLERLEQPAPAEAALRQSLRFAPGDSDVRRRLVSLVAGRGELREAAALLETAAESATTSEAATLLREGAAYARDAQDLDRALKLARKAHSLVPARGAELASLAELLYLRGAVLEALPLQETLASTADFTASADAAEATWLRLAELAESAGETKRAVGAYRKLLVERPLCEPAVQRLSALLEKDDPRGAFEVLVTHARALAPSEDTVRRLVVLAEKARAALADAGVAASLLSRAAEMATMPLPLRLQLASLYRETGRSLELLAELRHVAALSLQVGDVAATLAAHEEEASLAEATGRADDALRALADARDLLESRGRAPEAAACERRRAELLRDVKLDLAAAESALDRAFSLAEDLGTARLGAALAERRDDADAEALWLERALPLLDDAKEAAALRLRLAKLHLGVLADTEEAERFLRGALRQDRSLDEAETLLARLLERDGRLAELAAWYEECAEGEPDTERRAALLQRAAVLYRDRAGRPDAAAAAFIAARSARPDDLDLTAQAAELLHEVKRHADAAEFDAVLLEADPFREPVFSRHRAFLEENEDPQSLAELMLRRAQRQSDADAADSYLAAARAFRAAGARERALLCEDRAFELSPASVEAFERVRERAAGDVRRLSELLAVRAAALPPEEALPLLRERATRLLDAGEALLAAEAFDVYLGSSGDDVEALSARAELAAQSGGPAAARPYDRRLLSAGGETLPVTVRARTWLRLGHASLGANAYHDAADAFESVVSLEPEGERGREALSLLAEVHSRTGNAPGLYRASLQLAGRAEDTATAEVLYRRAADLFDDPKDAIDALLPLARLRPADASVIDRAVAGLRALGRHGDLLAVYESGAEAAGGVRAAELLLAAATVAAESLADVDAAWELTQRAAEAAPEDVTALRALVTGLREREETTRLLEALERLVPHLEDADEASVLRLELATLLRDSDQVSRARESLEAVVERGASGAGYAVALEELEKLLRDEPARRAEVQVARAELVSGRERLVLLLSSARAFESAGRLRDALKAAKAAVATEPDVDAAMRVAHLHRALGEAPRAAKALLQAARLASPEERPPLLLEAADLWEKAGEHGEALEVIERIATEAPDILAPAELAERFGRLGAFTRALQVGFAPAMAAGELTDALAMAAQAGDTARTREALWALVAQPDADAAHASALADGLRAERDAEGLLELAALSVTRDEPFAVALRDEVLRAADAPALQRLRALDELSSDANFGTRLTLLLPGLEKHPEALSEAVLGRVRALSDAARVEALAMAAEGWTSRRKPLLRERHTLEYGLGRFDAAARSLARLIEVEEDARVLAALHLEHGELLLSPLDQPDAARAAFERALDTDGTSLPALRNLLALVDESKEPAVFVSLAERLTVEEGPDAATPHRERLADAYEVLGQVADAVAQLEALPETEERLARRARLAEQRGLTGEALGLRERLTDEPGVLESILRGYLDAQLVSPAARLAERLFDAGVLSPEVLRLACERLSPVIEGAPFAVRVWPELLRAAPLDVDGWTLFAEALRLLERQDAAERADGVGAALSSSTATVPAAAVSALPVPTGFEHALPADSLPVTAERFPRLFAALRPLLSSLGASGLRVYVDPSGGVEGYLVSSEALVLGAGALSCFGSVELGYLSALALVLGEDGVKLSRPGEVPGFEAAAVAAFRAVPASLAAGRVLARLDAEVRGSDPARVDVGAVLGRGGAFRAVALCVLDVG
ncbi:flagellar hook-length control protein FliK [Myxococcus llanfairpwllgwyngyllgogerychwyrndrobwllllantysiliogogogochensis]|uniref:Flagellar hook-length control protein FliK n=1 Tax=Myxococcus llanfairpwllgwyngyllgogerychwyrndrobwllllantysiliogogogochensis TaxID=2590453 RepID=A0A540X3U1_9BACT|nr:flagellar hook-length control protein FliK [Myxococcus llanfairpwllgwyngyllgogerychwyrndrobwllllantysiliogogogochensis]TQF15354.1 flagellar hook-length control protein FliK [Myxococcus llanfairpwllgwyngyllgogerychwyrndrobwllllantysiliogogogochensis]